MSTFWTSILSISAFAVSLYALWKSYLKPFKLAVYDAGRVELGLLPNDNSSTVPALCVEFIFANHGARSGVIQDVALEVTFPSDDNKIRFLKRIRG